MLTLISVCVAARYMEREKVHMKVIVIRGGELDGIKAGSTFCQKLELWYVQKCGIVALHRNVRWYKTWYFFLQKSNFYKYKNICLIGHKGVHV